jgi:hypothetical protein
MKSDVKKKMMVICACDRHTKVTGDSFGERFSSTSGTMIRMVGEKISAALCPDQSQVARIASAQSPWRAALRRVISTF